MIAQEYMELLAKSRGPKATESDIQKADAALKGLFRQAFSGKEGRIVLGALLEDFLIFSKAETPEEVALKNYGTFFLTERLGVRPGLDTINALMLGGE